MTKTLWTPKGTSEGNSNRTWKGTCCQAQVRFSLQLKFNSFELDYEVGQLVLYIYIHHTPYTIVDYRLQEDSGQTDPLRLDGDRVSQDGGVQSQVECLKLWGHSLGDLLPREQALRICGFGFNYNENKFHVHQCQPSLDPYLNLIKRF